MNITLKLLLAVLSTEAARKLAVLAVETIAKRTKTTVDDVFVIYLAQALGVKLPVEFD